MLTHSITYELARRNGNVSNILNLLFEVFSYYEQIILPTLRNYEKATIADNMLVEIFPKVVKKCSKILEVGKV